MKKMVLLSCLFITCAISAYGQWYVKRYNVTDMDYLTQQQLEESLQSTRTSTYGSLAVMGSGGLMVLIERFFPYKEEDDEDVTLIESILGEKGVHKATIAGGIGLAAGGAVASLVFLGWLGTIKSTLKRNYNPAGSLSLSPILIREKTSHNLYPGVALTYCF